MILFLDRKEERNMQEIQNTAISNNNNNNNNNVYTSLIKNKSKDSPSSAVSPSMSPIAKNAAKILVKIRGGGIRGNGGGEEADDNEQCLKKDCDDKVSSEKERKNNRHFVSYQQQQQQPLSGLGEQFFI